MSKCRRRRSASAIVCWDPYCDQPLHGSVFQYAPPPLAELCAQLEKREEFVHRAADSRFAVLECQECDVGVGYDDGTQDTAMCFLCEQYAPARARLGFALFFFFLRL